MTLLFAQATIYLHLPILLVVFSLVYSATRHDRWDLILWEAVGWIVRIAGFLGTIGIVLYVLSTYPDYWLYLAGVGTIFFVMYLWATYHRQQPGSTAPATTGTPSKSAQRT